MVVLGATVVEAEGAKVMWDVRVIHMRTMGVGVMSRGQKLQWQ